MATNVATRTGDGVFSVDSWRAAMGFPFKVLPFVCLLGVLVAMASVPQFFVAISNRFADDSSPFEAWVNMALVWLADAALAVSGWFASPAVTSNLATITQFALITVVCLLPASLVRSARAHSWMPVALTASGFIAGLVAVPVTIWLIIASYWLVRLGLWLFGIFQSVAEWLISVLDWLSPFLLIVGGIIVVASAIYWLFQASGWYRAAAAGVVGLVLVGWLTDIFDPVLAFLMVLAEWILFAFGLVLAVLLVIILGLVVLGAIVALFGSIGRVFALSFTGAWEASRGAQKVTDLSAGVGLTLGIILLAAAIEGGPGQFGPWLDEVWRSTPIVGYVPPPVGLIDLLVPSMAEGFLATYFAGFTAAIDIMLLVLVALVGVLSLTLRTVAWEGNDGQRFRVAFPVLLAVGLGIVFSIPLLLLSIAAQGEGS